MAAEVTSASRTPAERRDTALGGSGAAAVERPRLSRRDELVTCLLGTWLLGGLHLDGWAHRNRDLEDSITTPWHAVLYSGWAATAAWITWVILREQRRTGARRLSAIPLGYAVGFAGVVTFGIGGLFDQVWHLALGVEQDIEAFLSPTHWFLAVGMFLMVSCSFRAAWSSPDNGRPTFREFAPTLWSVTLSTCMVSFAYNYLSLFVLDNPTVDDADLTAQFRSDLPASVPYAFAERLRMQGVGAEVIWTVLLMGVSLLVLRRWRPPFGTFTAIYGVSVAGVSAVWDFDHGWTIIGAVVGGLFADLLVHVLDIGPGDVGLIRVFSAVVPLVLWAAYFTSVGIAYGMGWTTPMWAGSVTFAAVIGLLVSFLVLPMTIPTSLTQAPGEEVLP